jgi:hypothetical protein
MDLKGTGYEGVDWIHLDQEGVHWWAVVNTVMNLWVPWKAGNFLTSWVTVNFSRSTLPLGVSWLVRRILQKRATKIW